MYHIVDGDGGTLPDGRGLLYLAGTGKYIYVQDLLLEGLIGISVHY